MFKGTIAVWIFNKNFGFINPQDGTERIFLHKSKVKSGLPEVGKEVLYDINPRVHARPQSMQRL